MDIFVFLTSLNKIAIFAFGVTLVFLSYEIYLLRKSKSRPVRPNIPSFKPDLNVKIDVSSQKIDEDKKIVKSNNFNIILLVVLLIVFGVISALAFIGPRAKTNSISSRSTTPLVQTIASSGIKLFNLSFEPLTNQQVADLKPQDNIVIGIETVAEAAIDMARIRVNKSVWETQDTASDFDSKNKVFYLKYKIATNEVKLKIEAQLHSKNDGWLGE